ncbi:energy-coupling factor ABC transporter ATP-binding protein [Paenibacillus tarimensis]|uniref:energy-coupling factor ABC transporter ATP-binding protein n=1 Tax=Paenibacillus tarimensis TaxID=416012 RepID=UPI001F3D47EB|nr:ABC transporter ATP-binding protein [Paenibacillus tarimensis]MCF2944685.1 energy-coupling factor ABC transporter ATP-binding protein [Paenibacillus tarimensis]
MTALLEARQLHYTYPASSGSALRGLSFRVPAGKRTVLYGHNGSGKSTFLLHAVGIHRPVEGQLLWKNSPLSYRSRDLKELRREIGLVFQDPEQQLILATPRQDMAYGLRNLGISEAELNRRTARMLTAMNLDPIADTPIHHLSLGQKKQVALAGILVMEPELLLLDEPTAYLDQASEQRLLDELERVHKEGMTVVMATHDTDLAYRWADWVIVMQEGQCIAEGTPAEIFGDYALMQRMQTPVPLLLDLWNTLPEELRGDTPPRCRKEMKRLLAAYARS